MIIYLQSERSRFELIADDLLGKVRGTNFIR